MVRLLPKVSIITPVCNGAAYIGEAIESVVAQTWDDWELIVVDDGSTDATPDILRTFVDPRIVCIRQNNQGAAGARNTGLDRARGEYVAFLDADDLYQPSALTDFVAYMDAHPEIDVVYSDGTIYDDENKGSLMRLSEIRPGISVGHILEALVLEATVITVPVCTMLRLSAIERNDARFDEKLVIGEDWDFWIQLAQHARFGYLDKLTCTYRVHHSRVTHASGLARRIQDLVHGRLKILNSEWFGQLSVATRHQFFYRLLVGLLADEPAQQQTILRSERLRNLPAQDQAALWRHVGVDHLLRRSNEAFALDCLQEAVRLWPADRRSQVLLRASNLGDSTPYHLVRMWHVMHQASERLRALGRHRPKPVPASLGPVGD